MANWCSTNIIISGNDTVKMRNLFDEFCKAEQEYAKSDFSFWEGKLLIHCGMTESDACLENCRGDIVDLELSDDGYDIYIDQEDAWEPHLGPVLRMIVEFYPEALLQYEAYEPSDEICCGNKPGFENNYIVDVFEPDKVPVAFQFVSSSEPLLASCFQNLLLNEFPDKPKDTPLSELISLFEDEFGEYLSVHKCEYVDAFEFAW